MHCPLYRQHVSIRFPKVRVTKALFVPLLDTRPQKTASLLAPISNGVGDDLACAATLRQPDPTLVAAPTHERPHLVQFKHVTFFGFCQRFLQGRLLRSFFKPGQHRVAVDAEVCAS